jgi:hypothetical protein
MLGPCMVTVLVLGAVMATGASAKLPEWGQCVATEGGTGGRYVDQACTMKAKGKGEPKVYSGGYEWTPAEEEFSSKNGSGFTLNETFKFETATAKIECTGASTASIMAFLESSAVTPLWKFTGCTTNGDENCSTLSIGSLPGEISNGLERLEPETIGWEHPGGLGFVERGTESEPVVGLSFKEVVNEETHKPEPFFTPVSCELEEGATPNENPVGTVLIGGDRVGGNGVIGALSPVNEMKSTYTLTYAQGGSGMQSPTRFAHRKPQTLQMFVHNTWEPVAFVGQIDLSFRENWEIRA